MFNSSTCTTWVTLRFLGFVFSTAAAAVKVVRAELRNEAGVVGVAACAMRASGVLGDSAGSDARSQIAGAFPGYLSKDHALNT